MSFKPCFVLLGFALALSACLPFRKDLSQSVVVQVNNNQMTLEELSRELAKRLQSFNALSAKDPATVQSVKKSIVNNFILRSLVQDWAQKNEIFVRKESLQEEIDKARKQYPDDGAFRLALAQEGLTYENWSAQILQNLLERQVMQKLRESLPAITTQEALHHYNANKSDYQLAAATKLRQIVVPTEEAAKMINDELRRGRKFVELAQQFSITPEGANGGELGWVERGVLEVYDAASRLGQGQRSGILKSRFGFHIIEVQAKRSARTLTFNEAEARIKTELLERKEQAAYVEWLEQQIVAAKVYKDEGLINGLIVETANKK